MNNLIPFYERITTWDRYDGPRHPAIVQRTLLMTFLTDYFYCPSSPNDKWGAEERGLYFAANQFFISGQREMRIALGRKYFKVYAHCPHEGHSQTFFFVDREKGTLHRPLTPAQAGERMYSLMSPFDWVMCVEGTKRQVSRTRNAKWMPFLYKKWKKNRVQKGPRIMGENAGTNGLHKVWDLYMPINGLGMLGGVEEQVSRMLSTRTGPDIRYRTRPSTPPWTIVLNRNADYHSDTVGPYVTYISAMREIEEMRGRRLQLRDRPDPFYFYEDDSRQRFRMKCPHHLSFDHERARATNVFGRPYSYPDHPMYEAEPRPVSVRRRQNA